MPSSAAPEPGPVRFIMDAWPLLALGVIGALIIRACVPVHPAPPVAGAAAPFDAATAVRIGNWHALAAFGALTPESGPKQVLEALNLLVVDFRPGSSALPESAEPVLLQALTVIETRPPSERYEITGHTDGSGSPLADLELSRRRAQAVVDFLVNQGVRSERLRARGSGDQDPVASEPGAESRFRNQRLEFALQP